MAPAKGPCLPPALSACLCLPSPLRLYYVPRDQFSCYFFLPLTSSISFFTRFFSLSPFVCFLRERVCISSQFPECFALFCLPWSLPLLLLSASSLFCSFIGPASPSSSLPALLLSLSLSIASSLFRRLPFFTESHASALFLSRFTLFSPECFIALPLLLSSICPFLLLSVSSVSSSASSHPTSSLLPFSFSFYSILQAPYFLLYLIIAENLGKNASWILFRLLAVVIFSKLYSYCRTFARTCTYFVQLILPSYTFYKIPSCSFLPRLRISAQNRIDISPL